MTYFGKGSVGTFSQRARKPHGGCPRRPLHSPPTPAPRRGGTMARPAAEKPLRMYAPHGVPISRPADSPAPVRELKTSEVVALEIVRGIVSDGLGTGDRLPTETE